ncbi:MAG: hypothetical protein QM665_01310 [Desulfovibrio sp.]
MFEGEVIGKLLLENGFTHLHHANTASTALTYLKNDAILSRQFVDSHNDKYWQTMQGTDSKDKEYMIYNDIFFDVENIWNRSDINYYGPVVFKFPVGLLSGKKVKISAENPVHWEGLPLEQRYIADVDKIIEFCTKGKKWNFKNHLIIPDTEFLSLNELGEILFYCSLDSYSGDPRNNPQRSFELLEIECNRMNITINKIHKESIPQEKHGLFYGFMDIAMQRATQKSTE